MIPSYVRGITNGLNIFDEKVIQSLLEKNIPVYDLEIQEGDLLFMPSGWWHHVVNIDESIALSCNFVSQNNYLPFEQQVRARIIAPQVKLDKLTKEIFGFTKDSCSQVVTNKDTLASCHFSENELEYLNYLRNQLELRQSLLDLYVN